MAVYKYLAAAPKSPPAEVEIEAGNPDEALAKLRRRNMVPIRFYGEGDAAAAGKGLFPSRSRIDPVDFTEQLAPLLAANIPLERALGIMVEGCRTDEQRDFVVSLRQGLHEGKKLSGLIRAYGRVFPGFYANLVEAGEESGCLGEVFGELLRFMKESKETRDFVISSSIYPAVILLITAGVSFLMFVVFIPRFANLFTDMGRAMPGSMQFLLAASDFIWWAWWMIPAGLFIVWQLVKWRVGPAAMNEWRSRTLLKLPVIGQLALLLEFGKFFRTMAIMLSNHVEIINTVRISVRVIGNRVLRTGFDRLETQLKSGRKLSDALRENSYLPPGTAAKIRVGEETGSVGPMLERIAEQLEGDSRRRIKRLLSIFEPLVIVFLALVVGVVVLAIFMAIMELNSVD